MAIKRMKLHYDEIVACPRPIAQLWEKLLSPNNAIPDYAALALTIEKGVTKQRRGEAWRLLVRARNSMDIQQQQECTRYDDYSLCRQVVDYDQFPLLDVPYEELLGQLTSHQHAIIIDLGRTFPTQKYFQASLGAGQLALYNLLKAYSLLDSQVGYCQGLSFIAGLLLMHLEENEAYYMLRFLMLELGLRRQYLPDMAALQVQLYQMARLLRDLHRDLYEHLEENEVSPTLYAAPWFLTLFASQFPLGFVVRVFGMQKKPPYITKRSYPNAESLRHLIDYPHFFFVYLFQMQIWFYREECRWYSASFCHCWLTTRICYCSAVTWSSWWTTSRRPFHLWAPLSSIALSNRYYYYLL